MEKKTGGMMKFSPELAELLEKQIQAAGYPASKRKMFGHETWFLNGYMFAGASTEGIWMHLGEQAVREALSTQPGVAPFSPGRGMVMKDYLTLVEPGCRDAARLGPWLERSSRHLLSRPPKPEGQAARKKANRDRR
jgi:TfoX/Sxy family transcriptional regulator of competence genes